MPDSRRARVSDIDVKKYIVAVAAACLLSWLYVGLFSLLSFLPLPDATAYFVAVWFAGIVTVPAIVILGLVSAALYPAQWLPASVSAGLIGSGILVGVSFKASTIVFVLLAMLVSGLVGFITSKGLWLFRGFGWRSQDGK